MASTSEQEDELKDQWSGVRPLDRESAQHEPLGCAGVAGEHGGVQPPSRRRRAPFLPVAERDEVSRGITRNGGRRCYRATVTDDAAWVRA